jgi:hypothetical protein
MALCTQRMECEAHYCETDLLSITQLSSSHLLCRDSTFPYLLTDKREGEMTKLKK